MHREGQAVRLHLLPKHAKATNLSGWLGMRSQCQGAGGHLLSPQKVALCPRPERSLCQACKMHGTIGLVVGTPTTYFSRQEIGLESLGRQTLYQPLLDHPHLCSLRGFLPSHTLGS